MGLCTVDSETMHFSWRGLPVDLQGLDYSFAGCPDTSSVERKYLKRFSLVAVHTASVICCMRVVIVKAKGRGQGEGLSICGKFSTHFFICIEQSGHIIPASKP